MTAKSEKNSESVWHTASAWLEYVTPWFLGLLGLLFLLHPIGIGSLWVGIQGYKNHFQAAIRISCCLGFILGFATGNSTSAPKQRLARVVVFVASVTWAFVPAHFAVGGIYGFKELALVGAFLFWPMSVCGIAWAILGDAFSIDSRNSYIARAARSMKR